VTGRFQTSLLGTEKASVQHVKGHLNQQDNNNLKKQQGKNSLQYKKERYVTSVITGKKDMSLLFSHII
jgi:hypothetical protein